MKVSFIFLAVFSLYCGGFFREGEGLPTGNDALLEQLKKSANAILDEDELADTPRSADTAELGKRKAVKSTSKRWPNGEIPYIISSSAVDTTYGSAIADVLAGYEAATCLDFIEHTTAPSGGYVDVTTGSGCTAHIGYKAKKRSVLLQTSNSACLGQLAHEFGHIIGFKHEHVRPDRDSYITIRSENIKSGYEAQFNIGSWDWIETYGIPYDYASVMHYRPTAFSVSSAPTMVTIDPMDMVDMGSNYLPDFYDLKFINLMYDCDSVCSTSLTCNNGGYQDKTCNCVCPPGWTGSDCSTTDPLPDSYKTLITGGSGMILSTNYPNDYPVDHVCQWHLKGTAAGQTITVSFLNFDLEDPNTSGYCDDDYLEIRTSDLYYGGTRFCGTSLPSTQTHTSASEPPEMLLLFHTDTNLDVDTGFQLTYTIS